MQVYTLDTLQENGIQTWLLISTWSVMEIHIIDLYKTAAKIEEAAAALEKIAASGRKILFVATKKQAKDIVAEKAKSVNMPYITERWPGGMLTNFVTIRKAVKKMAHIDRMKQDGSFAALSKREQLQVDRQRAKLEKELRFYS